MDRLKRFYQPATAVRVVATRAAGGGGSGNFGHAGRPGEVGGSAPEAILPNGTIDFETAFRGAPPALLKEASHLFDQSFGNADPKTVHETLNYIDVAAAKPLFDAPIHGGIDQVLVPEYQQLAVTSHSNPSNLIAIHTHPSGTAFSPADFGMVLSQRLGGAVVLGKEGSVYELKMQREVDPSEIDDLYDDLSFNLNLAREESLRKTDQYVSTHYKIPVNRLNRAEIISAYPQIELIHMRNWIEASDRTWRDFAGDHKDLLSYRRTVGKAGKIPAVKIASTRYAEAASIAFVLDDSDTFSIYAHDGGPRRKVRAAAQETALHRAADAHVARLSVALRYAFAVARKKLRGLLITPGQLASYTSVVTTLHKALDEVLPSKILPMVVAGGEVGAAVLRTAENFRAAKRTAKPIDFVFDAANQAAIDWADRHAAELIDGITETTRDAINNAVAEYLETGDWDTFTDDVLDAVGDVDRADRIARHEPMLAASEGQRQAWDQAVEAGLLTGDEKPTWIIVGDEKVCPICIGLDGKTRDLDGVYVGDDGEEYEGPPAHVSCLPGDSLVTPIGRVAASSERWFNGDLIVIRTASGHELSCTPNHPILTDHGWIAAHLLNIGDNVVCLRVGDRKTQVYDNHQYVPTCIQDIARFANNPISPYKCTVPLSSEDFHGDGEDSEIAIIRTNSLLRDRNELTFNKQVKKQSFAAVQSAYTLDSQCSRNLPGFAVGHTFNGIMSADCLLSSLFVGHVQPLQGLALALVTWCHAVQQQYAADNRATSIALLGDLIFGLAGNIETDDVLIRQRGMSAPLKEALIGQVSSDSASCQFTLDSGPRCVELRREMCFIRTSEIETSHLVSVSCRQFSGHVFNLETESQIYIGNGILSSNCRCTEGLS